MQDPRRSLASLTLCLLQCSEGWLSATSLAGAGDDAVECERCSDRLRSNRLNQYRGVKTGRFQRKKRNGPSLKIAVHDRWAINKRRVRCLRTACYSGRKGCTGDEAARRTQREASERIGGSGFGGDMQPRGATTERRRCGGDDAKSEEPEGDGLRRIGSLSSTLSSRQLLTASFSLSSKLGPGKGRTRRAEKKWFTGQASSQSEGWHFFFCSTKLSSCCCIFSRFFLVGFAESESGSPPRDHRTKFEARSGQRYSKSLLGMLGREWHVAAPGCRRQHEPGDGPRRSR